MAIRDLAVVVTAMNEARWLHALLPTIAAGHGALDFEVVVADIESTDDTLEVVARFPFARAVPVINRGFSHANNVAAATTDARYVLYLNADTELAEGTLAEMVAAMDERPAVGLAGVRQRRPTGEAAADDAAVRLPGPAAGHGAGQRAAGPTAWKAGPRPGSLLQRALLRLDRRLVHARAARGARERGCARQRFFFTAEEEDFCLRIRRAGWDVRHLPQFTIVHHAGRRGIDERFARQLAFAEMQFAAKHFGPVRLRAFQAALALNHSLRLLSPSAARRRASRAALDATLGRVGSPFQAPPATAMPAGQFARARSGEAT